MNPEKILIFGGFTEEEAEAIKEAARIWAERVRVAIEEAVAEFSRILTAVGPSDFEALDDLRKELEEIGRESRAQRRKMERSRAQDIEQRYRAEIRRCERERPYRRIYKPP
ncbi:hypothetical protein [Acutalibacter intestini]|jgi:hypothetical protein|uniref:hypothetical protein n=1 Tax=Acutalibacter intestini TaxID=3093659 RepID=UPI002AC8A540|nr:hypothetical protein [Acutalibacter sp. M00204]